MDKLLTPALYGLILAGGKAQRMQGHDKGLVTAHGKMLVEYALEKLAPQVDSLLISANRSLEQYKALGYPVVTDCYGDYAGPLAGILSGLEQIPEDSLLLVAPCDMPELPDDLAARMKHQMQFVDADICCVQTQDRLQPLVAIMHRRVHQQLLNFLQSGKHKVHDWLNELNFTTVDYSGHENQFININTRDELSLYELMQA